MSKVIDLMNEVVGSERNDAVVGDHVITGPMEHNSMMRPLRRIEKQGVELVISAGISCRLIPVPRQLSSDCGVCLRVNGADKERAAKLLEEANVEIDKVYDIAG